jgi:hypothetical protein
MVNSTHAQGSLLACSGRKEPAFRELKRPAPFVCRTNGTRRFEQVTDVFNEVIREAVAEVGHKEVAFLLDVDGSTRSDLINCRDLRQREAPAASGAAPPRARCEAAVGPPRSSCASGA